MKEEKKQPTDRRTAFLSINIAPQNYKKRNSLTKTKKNSSKNSSLCFGCKYIAAASFFCVMIKIKWRCVLYATVLDLYIYVRLLIWILSSALEMCDSRFFSGPPGPKTAHKFIIKVWRGCRLGWAELSTGSPKKEIRPKIKILNFKTYFSQANQARKIRHVFDELCLVLSNRKLLHWQYDDLFRYQCTCN